MFSFIEDPDGAIRTIKHLVGAGRNPNTTLIRIRQKKAKLIDHCAQSVASAIALELYHEFGIVFGGDLPDDPDLQEIVRATGLPQALGITGGDEPKFLPFPLQIGYPIAPNATVSTPKEKITSKLTEYVNKCLGRYRYVLSDDDAEALGSLVGEILGNSEDHSGRSVWWVGGYLRQPEGKTYGDCHLTLFNFGKTIYQSLNQLPTSARLRKEIDELVRHHRQKRLFRTREWSEENLWTLYALQEAVSRFNKDPSMGDRGMGTVKIIEFFQEIGQTHGAEERPKMCIVSGSTQILFDGEYCMQYQTTEQGQQRRVIAFNTLNDLRRPPDARVVRKLHEAFPGTLISLRFYLDPAHLEKL